MELYEKIILPRLDNRLVHEWLTYSPWKFVRTYTDPRLGDISIWIRNDTEIRVPAADNTFTHRDNKNKRVVSDLAGYQAIALSDIADVQKTPVRALYEEILQYRGYNALIKKISRELYMFAKNAEVSDSPLQQRHALELGASQIAEMTIKYWLGRE